LFSFIALICEAHSPAHLTAIRLLSEKLRADSSWVGDVDHERLKVFHRCAGSGASRAYPLHDGSGVVLGTLFTRRSAADETPATEPVVLSESDSAHITRSRGRYLITAYWGRYVAVVRDADASIVRIMRDPSGHLPCFRISWSGIRIYFSNLGDYARLGVSRLSMNWDYMAARMVHSGLHSRETGLNEVEELHAGECDAVGNDARSCEFYWHPFQIARLPPLDDPVDAARRLRTTAKACIQSWAACYPGILHRLSGGLDSSIVLGCLQDAPIRPRITCLTYFPQGEDACEDGDERSYSRISAARAGCNLIEIPRAPTQNLEKMFEMGCFPVPMIFNGRNVEETALERELAQTYGATASFGGEGGDQLFYQAPLQASIGDYVWHRGITCALLRAAWDVARTEELSVWRLLQRGLSEGLLRTPWTPNAQLLRRAEFIPAAVLEELARTDCLRARFAHPWWQFPETLPHGKSWHILWLSAPPHFYTALARPADPERVEPLTSQPLVELALQIPTFTLTTGGKERALARQAFSREVPAEILNRRFKASIEGFIRRTLLNNIRLVRETLLDGVLVQHRLLDRRRLEAVLSGRNERIFSAPVSVYDFLGLEVWLRGWTTATRDPTALKP
jgi:asparagine synthase (glutamine-hydrolysing)